MNSFLLVIYMASTPQNIDVIVRGDFNANIERTRFLIKR